jgi:gas vesicle protein
LDRATVFQQTQKQRFSGDNIHGRNVHLLTLQVPGSHHRITRSTKMQNSQTNDQGKYMADGSSSNLMYLVAGCGIGATLALLFAPKSGRELRTDISAITRQGYDETVDLAHELKERSAELYQSVKESADRVYDVAATRLRLAETAIENSSGGPDQLVNGEIGRTGRRTRKPSDTPPAAY